MAAEKNPIERIDSAAELLATRSAQDAEWEAWQAIVAAWNAQGPGFDGHFNDERFYDLWHAVREWGESLARLRAVSPL